MDANDDTFLLTLELTADEAEMIFRASPGATSLEDAALNLLTAGSFPEHDVFIRPCDSEPSRGGGCDADPHDGQ